MAARSPRQQAARRRIERGIRIAAPALDLLLFAGHQVSRIAGRNELAPEPPRRAAGPGELQARLKRSTT